MRATAVVLGASLFASTAGAAEEPRFSAEDYAQHVTKLRERLPRGFTVAIEPPFVVIGDEAPEVVKKRAAGTVRWAVEKLKKDFFARDPGLILDIWLFKDRVSYERNVLALFGDRPSTPFGYYSRHHRALIMNIATGGGTLVHELVHPFMEANVPDCPAWLNEGLGSLYEQSSEREGHIVGLTNWRLEGLQEAIRARDVPAIRELARMSDAEFYGRGSGTHYAAARYLLYDLQQRGRLIPFFREYLANRTRDPSGYDTLERVLGRPDMRAFEKAWHARVLGLTFP
jgi:hypothetical protein